MRRSSEVFRPDRGLRVRMAFAILLNLVLLVGLLALGGWLLTIPDGWSLVASFVVLALVGAFGKDWSRKKRRRRRHVPPSDANRLERAVQRLSLRRRPRRGAPDRLACRAGLGAAPAL